MFGEGSVMNIDLSVEIQEIELGKEELDAEGAEVDSDVLILEKGSRLMEQAMREVARQLALVARVDVDIFTDALLGRVFAEMCQRRAEELDRKVFVFRLPAQ